jgi:hypothetical protein
MLGSMKTYVRDALLTTALFGSMSVALAHSPNPQSQQNAPQAGNEQSSQSDQAAKIVR